MSELTCGLNYEAEYERLKAENAKLREEFSYFEEKARCTERENEILRAKMSMVYLIYGCYEHIESAMGVRDNSEMAYRKGYEDAKRDFMIPAAAIAPVQKWISVKDRLPEAGGYVVCIAKRNQFSRFMPMVAKIEKNGWVNPITEQYISAVSHWMPIPEPPKEE